nr:hypothetical protein [Tanacetum cinerariifolium]
MNPGVPSKSKPSKAAFIFSFKDAVAGSNRDNRVKISIEEDEFTSRKILLLRVLWKTNVGSINGSDDIKPWEETGELHGMLTWMVIDGIPILGRNIAAVKAIARRFDGLLEVGHLNFDSKIITLVKALILTYSMREVGQLIDVVLNNKSDPGSMFEEEVIGPSLEAQDGGGSLSDEENPRIWEHEKSHVSNPSRSKIENNEVNNNDGNQFFGSINSLGPHAKGINPPPSYHVDSPLLPHFVSMGVMPIELVPLPDLNDPINYVDDNNYDKLIWMIFYSFQRLYENINMDPSLGSGRKKKKKKLVVGDFTLDMLNSQRSINGLDGEEVTKFISGNIGYYFKPIDSKDSTRSSRSCWFLLGVYFVHYEGLIPKLGLGCVNKKTWIKGLIDLESYLIFGV